MGCNCTFDEEAVFDTSSEIMAASIGAMSPLLLTGVGFAVWKYIQSKSQSISFERAPSDVSDDYYDSRQGSKGRVSPQSSASDYNYARRGSTPLSITDTENEFYLAETPVAETPEVNQSDRWNSSTRAAPPSNAGRATIAPAKSESLNGWMS